MGESQSRIKPICWNRKNPAKWGSINWLTNKSSSECLSLECRWSHGDTGQVQGTALHTLVEMCGFRAALGLDVKNNSVCEQCHGRDPNLLHSPEPSASSAWSDSSTLIVSICFVFSSFCFPTLSGPFSPRICRTDSLILHPIGWSKLFWVSFTSHEAVASGGCTEIILCRAHSILGTKILNPGCGSQG